MIGSRATAAAAAPGMTQGRRSSGARDDAGSPQQRRPRCRPQYFVEPLDGDVLGWLALPMELELVSLLELLELLGLELELEVLLGLELEVLPGLEVDELLLALPGDERLEPEELPSVELLDPIELPEVDVSEPSVLPCDDVLEPVELLSPSEADEPPPCTPSAERVCWSRLPDEPICCDCWNCLSAERVCGPSLPSIWPASKPLSLSACCTSRTVDSSFCDDAPCCREAEEDDCCCELPGSLDFDALLSFANAAVEESARAAMTRWRSFIFATSFPVMVAVRRQDVHEPSASCDPERIKPPGT